MTTLHHARGKSGFSNLIDHPIRPYGWSIFTLGSSMFTILKKQISNPFFLLGVAVGMAINVMIYQTIFV